MAVLRPAPGHSHLARAGSELARCQSNQRQLRYAAALVVFAFAACEAEAEPGAPVLPAGTEVGLLAPSITGRLPSGEPFTLVSSAGSPLVIVFYRSIECGLCRLQLERMQQNLPAYERSGAQLVALTLDAPEVNDAWSEEAALDFPVVAVDSSTFGQWGAMATEAPVPLPATYVVDASGVVRFRHIGRNAADRTSDAEIVAILEGLSSP